jgi:glutamyl-tRNA synthetase
MKVRTRFAPSPTGYLHIGGVRTALFNWLFARHHGGSFILRIEDTDIARSTTQYVEAILNGMEWLGLNWDEGPYFQSKRIELYRSKAKELLEKGLAYRCYCTPEELDEKRKRAIAEKRKPKYDGTCRPKWAGGKGHSAEKGRTFAIRFLSPQEGITVVNDLVKGQVTFKNEELDDLIILRSDGTPTYNFCVVVDDAEMGITHVIRGDDHLNNTPRQIHMFRALGYEIPNFAHLPLILGEDRTRLSKRHGATSLEAYREKGYIPNAILNYLARLGWSHGNQERFTVDELIRYFSLDNVGKSAGVFSPEKLLDLNAYHIKQTPPERLAELLKPFLEKKGYRPHTPNGLIKVVTILRERSKTLLEMAEGASFYFEEDIIYEKVAAGKYLTKDVLDAMTAITGRIHSMEEFSEPEIEKLFRTIAQEKGIKMVKLAQAIRVALTGKDVSPGLFEVMDVLGKERVLKRLKKAIDYIIYS